MWYNQEKDQKGESIVKSTGILRSVDELGRIVLPKSMRQNLEISERDQLEIYTEGDRIILRKYQPSCVFCETSENIVFFNGKRVCSACLEELKRM